MKELKLILILTTLLSLSALAEFKETKDALAKMQSYGPTYFADARDEAILKEISANAVGPAASPSTTDDKIDVVYEDLEDAVKLLVTQKKTDDVLLDEVLRVASLSLDNDPTWFAGEVILPLYKKDKAAFTEALKKLSTKNARNLEEAVKNSASEETKGNG